MGAWFRLKAPYFDASYLGARAQVVVTAMKEHGLVLADNGSPWFFQGEQNAALADGSRSRTSSRSPRPRSRPSTSRA